MRRRGYNADWVLRLNVARDQQEVIGSKKHALKRYNQFFSKYLVPDRLVDFSLSLYYIYLDRNLPDSWKEDLEFHYQCKHYLYEHRPIFYGIQMVHVL